MDVRFFLDVELKPIFRMVEKMGVESQGIDRAVNLSLRAAPLSEYLV
jgi:hypothetical protein